jgi:hypothetical protein
MRYRALVLVGVSLCLAGICRAREAKTARRQRHNKDFMVWPRQIRTVYSRT